MLPRAATGQDARPKMTSGGDRSGRSLARVSPLSSFRVCTAAGSDAVQTRNPREHGHSADGSRISDAPLRAAPSTSSGAPRMTTEETPHHAEFIALKPSDEQARHTFSGVAGMSRSAPLPFGMASAMAFMIAAIAAVV